MSLSIQRNVGAQGPQQAQGPQNDGALGKVKDFFVSIGKGLCKAGNAIANFFSSIGTALTSRNAEVAAPRAAPRAQPPPPTRTPGYPMPGNMSDVLNGDVALKGDFRAFCEKRFMTENLDFLEAHHAFSQNPTLQGARDIMTRFIGVDSVDYVNVEASMSSAIRDTLTGPGADALTPDQLVQVFDKAQGSVVNDMMNPQMSAFAKFAREG